jgi:hypothetical protein
MMLMNNVWKYTGAESCGLFEGSVLSVGWKDC